MPDPKIVSASVTAMEAEIQLLFEFLKKRSTDRWFLGALRETWTARPMRLTTANVLLQLPFEAALSLLEEEKQRRLKQRQ
jgi:hypothetical protein